MPYLKYEKSLYEISEDKAKRLAKYIDEKLRVPMDYERFDYFKCEILKDLPWNWQDYKLIDDPNIKKLSGPEYEEKYVEVDRNTVKKIKVKK